MLETQTPEVVTTKERFWKGPDVRLARDYTFPAHNPESRYTHPTIVHVRVNRSHFPPDFQYEDLSALHFSMRSRFAQLGLEVQSLFLPHSHLLRGLSPFNQAMWESIENGQEIDLPVQVRNLSARPISVQKDAEFFRIFTPAGAEPLTGEALKQAMKDGKIKIGEGWSWFGEHLPNGPLGINVPLTDNIRWIPPSTEPASIAQNEKNYRAVIDSLLVPAPETQNHILLIGETLPVKLSPDINVILGEYAGQGDPVVPGYVRMGRHIASRLLDGGSPDWPIRLEIHSPTLPKESFPKTVMFEFFE